MMDSKSSSSSIAVRSSIWVMMYSGEEFRLLATATAACLAYKKFVVR